MSEKSEKLTPEIVEDFKINLRAKLSTDKRTLADVKREVKKELDFFYEQSSGLWWICNFNTRNFELEISTLRILLKFLSFQMIGRILCRNYNRIGLSRYFQANPKRSNFPSSRQVKPKENNSWLAGFRAKRKIIVEQGKKYGWSFIFLRLVVNCVSQLEEILIFKIINW